MCTNLADITTMYLVTRLVSYQKHTKHLPVHSFGKKHYCCGNFNEMMLHFEKPDLNVIAPPYKRFMSTSQL